MRRILYLVLFWILSLLPAWAERLPVAQFVQPRAVVRISLSRDGEYFAYSGENGNEEDVFIGRVNAKGKILQVEIPSMGPKYYGRIRGLHWVSSKRILIETNEGLVAVDRDGRNILALSGSLRTRMRPREDLYLRMHGLIYASKTRDDDYVLLNEYNVETQPSVSGFVYLQLPNVVRMNTRTGDFVREMENPGDVYGWLADENGVVRVGPALRKDQKFLTYRENLHAGWHDVAGLSTAPDDWSVLGMNDRGDKCYISKTAANGLAAIYTFDLSAGKLGELVLRDETYDLGAENDAEIIESVDGRLLGIRYVNDLPRTLWKDEGLALVQRQVDASLRNAVNSVVELSSDQQILLIKSSSARNPGSYYVLDRAKGTLDKLGDVMPALPPEKLAEMRPLQFSARDGVRLHGYITVPLGREMKNLPLVVLPHEGPRERDTYEFNTDVQFLANRGYAVLQVNYRGSLGLGIAFQEMGVRAMGTATQDDIEDATRWVIKQGIADPKRVAIVGSSFGGYSALMGLIRTPELYRCGVSIGGITDWVAYLKNDAEMLASVHAFHVKLYGDPQADAAMLKAISPVNLADKIRAPLLIIHGRDDPSVPYEQVKAFMKAMDKAGRPYELLAKYNEAHRFSSYDSRVELYQRLEAFLTKHMPADAEK